jgi:hypothetical protein
MVLLHQGREQREQAVLIPKRHNGDDPIVNWLAFIKIPERIEV